MGVSRPALYNKLNGMELGISQGLVRYSASHLQRVIEELEVPKVQIRQHKSLPVEEISSLEKMGATKTGKVFEQQVKITDSNGLTLQLRRVVIKLHQSTRHGDKEVAILTHLPNSVADAEAITQLYLTRWNLEREGCWGFPSIPNRVVEGMFQVITDTFNCELNTASLSQSRFVCLLHGNSCF